MNNLISRAAIDCHVPESWVTETIRHGSSRVKKLQIPKKNSNKLRPVSRPSAELEILQRWLTLTIFEKMDVHDSAMAFRPNRSILKNAERHRNSKFFIRIDFENFFHSITYQDLFRTISKSKILSEFDADVEAQSFIQRVCFDQSGCLPIGFISSPSISNIVMYNFDLTLSKKVDENIESLGNAVITRYADDIVFSTNVKGGCNQFLELVTNLTNKWTSPRLRINREKTIFSSKAGGSAFVTGLRVCSDSHITVTRKYKDQLRLMLSLYSKGKLNRQEYPSLRGHLSYVQSVAPQFFSNICAKFTNEIKSLRHETDQKKESAQ